MHNEIRTAIWKYSLALIGMGTTGLSIDQVSSLVTITAGTVTIVYGLLQIYVLIRNKLIRKK